MVQFMIQGNRKNEWWLPLPTQISIINPLYQKWFSQLGQGGMVYPGTELTRIKMIGDFKYLICINGENSYIQNHSSKRKRLIHFLPLHDGS